jgi:hypothetical protein
MAFWPPDSLSAIIGAPVTGGIPGAVLFVGPTGLLDQDPGFFDYLKSTHELTLTRLVVPLITGDTVLNGSLQLTGPTSGIFQGGGCTGPLTWRGQIRAVGDVTTLPVSIFAREAGAVATDLAHWYFDNEVSLALSISGAGVVKPAVLLDLSTIPAANAELKVAATSDVPVTTWTAGVPSTDPAGYVKLDVAGAARYIPFWT